LEADISKALRTERIEAYRKLWALTEPFSSHGWKERAITHAEANRLSSELNHWYYTEGGLFLSEEARATYFALRDSLTDVAQSQPPESTVTEADYWNIIQKPSSALRTALAEDVGTRQRGSNQAMRKASKASQRLQTGD
jgi:hypothetical protein